MAAAALATNERRDLPRDEVHFRAKAYGSDGVPFSVLIVNLSAQGMMARVDFDRPEGERLHISLPVLGSVIAEVRWSLGGRIGCELDRAIGMADYYEVLAAMLKGAR
jgi:hypothetical protein